MPATTAENEPIAATAADKVALERLREMMTREDACDLTLVSGDGETVEAPAPVLRVLRRAVEALTRDRVVRLETYPRDLAVEDAAELLSLSVQEVETLIDEGTLPAVVVRNRRCIPFDALIAYRTNRTAERRASMIELVRISEELGLYEIDGESG